MTTDMVQESVRSRFQRWFEHLGVSQAELAERLRCDQAALSRLLSGKRGAGLALAVAIERESASWKHGPIRTSEWTEGDESAA